MSPEDILEKWWALRPRRTILVKLMAENLSAQNELISDYDSLIGSGLVDAMKDNLDKRSILMNEYNAMNGELESIYALGDRYHEQYVAALDKEIEARRSGE